MKSLSLKTYSKNYLYELSGSLKVKEMAKQAVTTNHRLFVPLAVYAYYMDCPNSWFEGNCRSLLDALHDNVVVPEDDKVLQFLQQYNDEEVLKFCKTFLAENKQRDQTELKNQFRTALKKLQREKSLTDYQLCKMAGANPGNFHLFFNKGMNDKLSVKKCNEAFMKAKAL